MHGDLMADWDGYPGAEEYLRYRGSVDGATRDLRLDSGWLFQASIEILEFRNVGVNARMREILVGGRVPDVGLGENDVQEDIRAML